MRSGGRQAFTQKQVDRMRQMHDEGMTLKDIARVYRVSANTVGEYLRGEAQC